jgi:hypothetical protein
MSQESRVKAICPLFHFEISPSMFVGKHTTDELKEHAINLRERINQGIQILDNVKIRLITKEELERFKAFNKITFWSRAISELTHRTFVIELLLTEADREEAISKIFKILLALRLYKKDAVLVKILIFEDPIKSTSAMTVFDSPFPEWFRYPYSVKIEDIEEFMKFVAKVFETDLEKRGSLRIACERFSRSCEEHKDDEKIIDFMIAFEALFKSEKVYSNIGKFIGLGCSMLLGEDEKEREDINEFLIDAYWIRNKIVHGSVTIPPISGLPTPIEVGRSHHRKTYEMREVISRLQEYLRESIKRLM